MGLIKDVRATNIGQDAARARAEGRYVFLCRIVNPVGDRVGFSGSVSGVAEQIEAVEGAGWALSQMSYVDDKRGVAGYYLFRRR